MSKMDIMENGDGQMDPLDEYLNLLKGSADLMVTIAQGMRRGMLYLVDEISKPIVAFMNEYNKAVLELDYQKSLKERRRARYLRMTTGKHNQRARKSGNRKRYQ